MYFSKNSISFSRASNMCSKSLFSLVHSLSNLRAAIMMAIKISMKIMHIKQYTYMINDASFIQHGEIEREINQFEKAANVNMNGVKLVYLNK